MNIEQIHPELREAVQRFPKMPLHNRFFVTLFKLLGKVMPGSKCGPGVDIEDRKLQRASVRIYRPQGAASGAGLLWIHGGGLIIGGAKLDNRTCGALARDLQLVVVSVEYRLAPEHPFPAAIDDCFEAWQWFVQQAPQLGVDPARIAVSGQSAGGGLAAALAQRVHDSGGVQPAAQALFCPMLDDRTALRSELDAIAYPLWPNRSNRAGWSWYLGQPAGAATLPPYAAAARREDLTGLAPAWISVGDIELFYDEDCRYAERLQQAGVPCQLHVSPQAPHGFEVLAPDAALTQAMFLSAYRFLCERLGLDVDTAGYSFGARSESFAAHSESLGARDQPSSTA